VIDRKKTSFGTLEEPIMNTVYGDRIKTSKDVADVRL
jgi:hypothetical protein